MCLCVVLVLQDTSRHIKIHQDISRYIKTHQDTSINIKIHRDTSRYITTMNFVMPKIAVQERKFNFNFLKNNIAFGFRFSESCRLCEPKSERKPVYIRTFRRHSKEKIFNCSYLKLKLYVAVSADKTAVWTPELKQIWKKGIVVRVKALSGLLSEEVTKNHGSPLSTGLWKDFRIRNVLSSNNSSRIRWWTFEKFHKFPEL